MIQMVTGTSTGEPAGIRTALHEHVVFTCCRCSVFTARSLFSVDSGVRLADDQ